MDVALAETYGWVKCWPFKAIARKKKAKAKAKPKSRKAKAVEEVEEVEEEEEEENDLWCICNQVFIVGCFIGLGGHWWNPVVLSFIRKRKGHCIPFVKRPFEWEIRGGAHLAHFCCVLRVTWCHCVCFSCYLRQNGATINVSKFKVLPSRLFLHIRCCFVEPAANSPNFTQDSLQIQGCTIRTNFVPICPTLHSFAFLLSSHCFSLFDYVANAFVIGVHAVQA